jgi:hypothetical protein
MIVKTVSISYERMVDLGNFNSIKVRMYSDLDIEEGDDLDECMQAAWKWVKENVRAQIVPTHKDVSADVERYIRMVPVERQPVARALLDESPMATEKLYLGLEDADGTERVVLVGDEARAYREKGN